MLKTSGHVKKYYKACCTIYDDFKKRNGVNVTFEDFLQDVEKWASKISDPSNQLIFRGDMLEILAEIFFGAFANDPAVGLKDYTPVPLTEDYGVDGRGKNAAGTDCVVQVKYRGDPTDFVTYAEIARTFTSGVLQFNLPLDKNPDSVFIFTSAYDVTAPCKTVLGDKIHLLTRGIIKNKIDNNVNFWDYAYNEILNLFLPGGSLHKT